LKKADIPRFIEMAKATRGIVIDIRNYPTDFPIFDLGGHLTSKPADFATFTDGDLANPRRSRNGRLCSRTLSNGPSRDSFRHYCD
jgi:hypothetical protein